MNALRLAAWLVAALSSLAPAMDGYRADTCPHGELALRSGMAIARADGTGDDIGNAIGTLCKAQIAALTRAVAPTGQRGALARIPDDYRGELTAIARASGIGDAVLATANLVIDPG